MNMYRRIGALTIVFAAALALAGVQEYSLKPAPKAGEVLKYKMSGEMSVMGQTVQLSAVMVNKTTKVEANGNYVVESSMTDGKIVLNGSEMDLGEQPSTTTTYKPDGTVVSVAGETAELGGARMANLTSFVVSDKSVKVGDSWKVEIKGETAKSTVDVVSNYKLEAIEKVDSVDTAKVSYETKESGETPAIVSGTAWVDVKTGNAVKVESTWKDVPIPGAPAPISGKMTMTRIP